jgi:hypothetical protein
MDATAEIPGVDVERLVRDIDPAEVLLPDGRLLSSVRVFVTSTRLLAFKAGNEGGITLALDLPLEQPCSVPASRATLGQGALEARLADGSTAWINRGHGCGCGSPLKALAPPVSWTGR